MRSLPLLPAALLVGVTGCSLIGETDSPPATDPAAGLPPAAGETRTAAALPHGAQGPMVARAVPAHFAPPVGQCRIWLPGVAPADQPEAALCSRARAHVPLGALLVQTPREGVIEVTRFDEFVPDRIVAVVRYDAVTGDPLPAPQADPER